MNWGKGKRSHDTSTSSANAAAQVESALPKKIDQYWDLKSFSKTEEKEDHQDT